MLEGSIVERSMTGAGFDVWIDGASLPKALLARLRTGLSEEFLVPTEQIDVLLNGNSHRIKRSCDSEDVSNLLSRFQCWGVSLRIEPSEGATARPFEAELESGLSLAPAGAPIPNLPSTQKPTSVTTDHLYLID